MAAGKWGIIAARAREQEATQAGGEKEVIYQRTAEVDGDPGAFRAELGKAQDVKRTGLEASCMSMRTGDALRTQISRKRTVHCVDPQWLCLDCSRWAQTGVLANR